MAVANHKHKQTAFSLLEVIVSMAIVGMVLVMLNSVIVNLTIVARKSLARSFVREEISRAIDNISSDIRNADRVGQCEGTYPGGSALCVIIDSTEYYWSNCVQGANDSVCKYDRTGQLVVSMSPQIDLQQVSFEPALSQETTFSRRSILITLVASHSNTDLDVTNVIRQTVVSTRNYLIE